jgi:hypothetical protein
MVQKFSPRLTTCRSAARRLSYGRSEDEAIGIVRFPPWPPAAAVARAASGAVGVVPAAGAAGAAAPGCGVRLGPLAEPVRASGPPVPRPPICTPPPFGVKFGSASPNTVQRRMTMLSANSLVG